VERVITTLSPEVRDLLDQVVVVVQEEPPLDARGDHEDLFGLYQGVPITERGSGYTLALPDQITIFMGPLERACETRSELDEQIRITVLHELGHHLGYDEDGLDALGLT